jgi:hypothetical protein
MKLEQKRTALHTGLASERSDRLRRLRSLEVTADDVRRQHELMTRYEAVNLKIHQACVLLLSLSDVMNRDVGFTSTWSSLQHVAKGDRILMSAVQSIPSDVVTNGVASLSSLQSQFDTSTEMLLRQEAYAAATVKQPQQQQQQQTIKHPSMLGVAVARVFRALTLSEQRPMMMMNDDVDVNNVDDHVDDDHVRITRVGHYLHSGDVAECIRQLEQLSPLVRAAAEPLMMQLSSRLTLQQAIDVIQAHTIVLHEAMSTARNSSSNSSNSNSNSSSSNSNSSSEDN